MIDEIHVKLTKKQYDQVQTYLKEHQCKEFKEGAGGFGSTSKLSFIVGSTSIGETLDIFCPYCKEILNITDIDTW